MLRTQRLDEKNFYMNCRAAYLAVFRSSLTNITSKEQLCLVLQQAGHNPSQKTLDKYWPPRTRKLNFDDFYEILKQEKPTELQEVMRVFRKLDVSGSGLISHADLAKILTSSGEKMSQGEVNAVFSLADVNSEGKLDYEGFCRVWSSTAEQLQTAALQRLETDSRLKRLNFGSQADSSELHTETLLKSKPDNTHIRDGQSSSRPSSARSRRSPTTAAVSLGTSMGTSVTKSTKLPEAKNIEGSPWRRASSVFSVGCVEKGQLCVVWEEWGLLEAGLHQDWHQSTVRGCFFLEEDGTIVSLQYQLYLPQTTNVHLSIQPFPLNHTDQKSPPWMNVDTALFVVVHNKTKEESNLVCFTEHRDRERYMWRGELSAGSYLLLPFTSGCRLRKKTSKSVTKPTNLVQRNQSGELELTREFRVALSDIFEVIDVDGNGLLSLQEYNFFEQRTSGENCDEDAWAICKETFDTRGTELTKQGFLELNLMEASDREGDSSDLWLTLEAMGYNHSLEMVEACPFLIDVHCEDVEPVVQAVSLETGLKMLNSAVQKSICSKGEAQLLKGHDSVYLYTYRGDNRISTVIANKSNQKVTVHINNDQSRNCCSSRGMSVFAMEIPARTKMLCQHVLPVNERQEWMYSCAENVIPAS